MTEDGRGTFALGASPVGRQGARKLCSAAEGETRAASMEHGKDWQEEYNQFASWALNGALGGGETAATTDPPSVVGTLAVKPVGQNAENNCGDLRGGARSARGLHRVSARARFKPASPGPTTSPAAAKVRVSAGAVLDKLDKLLAWLAGAVETCGRVPRFYLEIRQTV